MSTTDPNDLTVMIRYTTTESELNQWAEKIKSQGFAEVKTQVQASELVLWCQREFPEMAYVKVGRASYEFFVYNDLGRQALILNILGWLKMDRQHVSLDHTLLYTLGAEIPPET